MAKKTNQRKDFTQIAYSIVQRVTGAVADPIIPPKKKAAVESGKRGGLKGGVSRAKKLTAKRRSEIAKKAAKARWG